MKGKISGLVLAAAVLLAPVAVFADSNVTATSHGGSSINPAGTVLVPTGSSQGFSISGATNVLVDGVSQGSINFYNFVGDLSDHTIDSMGATGGGMLFCSGPMAPGWNVSLPDGGCGPKATPVYLPTHTVHNEDGSYTFGIVR